MVLITGTNFDETVSKVEFGSYSSGTNFAVLDSTSLVAYVPAGSGTNVTVKVTNSSGYGQLASGFTFDTYEGGGGGGGGSAPTVSGIAPETSAYTDGRGGDAVVVSGSGFTTANAVFFGTIPAEFTLSSSTPDSSLTAYAPAQMGTVYVTVRNAYGTSATGSQCDFLYGGVSSPTVSGIAPAAGWPGTVVTITGTGFDTTTQVMFGTYEAQYTYVDATHLTAIAPVGPAAGSAVNVVVYNQNGASAQTNNFTYQQRTGLRTTATGLSDAPYENWSGSDITVTLTADAGGGPAVAGTYYRVNGGTIQTYSSAFQVTTDGCNLVEFWSVDVTGLKEPTRSGYANKLTAGGVPTGLTVTAGINTLHCTWNPVASEGAVSYKVYWGAQNPPTDHVQAVGQAYYIISHPYADGGQYVQVSSVDALSRESSKCSVVGPTTPLQNSTEIADHSITNDKLVLTMRPPTLNATAPTLPATEYPAGSTYYNTTDDLLYVTKDGNTWTKVVNTTDLDGTIATNQIADDAVTWGKLATELTPPRIVSSLPTLPDSNYPADSYVVLTTDDKLYVTKTGLADSWVKVVNTTDLDGTIATTQIADDAVTWGKLATDLAPPRLKSSAPTLPDADYPAGSTYYNTTDDHLYVTEDGNTWVRAVRAAQLDGQVVESQIANDAVTNAKIYAGAVSALELASDAVTADKIAAGTIWSRSLYVGNFENLIINGTSEMDVTSAPTNAVEATGISTDYAYQGTRSRKLQGGDVYTSFDVTGWIPVQAGEIYRYGATMRLSASSTGHAYFQVVFKQVGEVYDYGNTGTVSGTSWEEKYGSLTVPSGYVQMKFQCATYQLTASKYAYFDNMMCTRRTDANLLVDGTVTTDKLAANAVTAAKIAADTITAAEIATDTITAAEIATGTITAAEIATDTITSGCIAAGAISASELAASSVYAKNLMVANFDNLIPNPMSELDHTGKDVAQDGGDLDFRGVSSDYYFHGAHSRKVTDTNGSHYYMEIAQRIPCAEGEQYFGAGYFRCGVTEDADHGVKLLIVGIDASETAVQYSFTEFVQSTSWTAKTVSFTVASTVVALRTYVEMYGSAAGRSGYADELLLRRKNDGFLIVDGAITTDKLAANAVTAAKIAADTITAAEIATGTITATEIAADTITAAKIAAGAIGADELAADSVYTKNLMIGNWVNLIPNPESEWDHTGKTTTMSGDNADMDFRGVSSTLYYRGAHSREFPGNGAGQYCCITRNFPAHAGDTFYLEAIMRCTSATGAGTGAQILFCGVDSGGTGKEWSGTGRVDGTTWTVGNCTYTVTDTTVVAVNVQVTQTVSAGNSAWFDDLKCYRVSEGVLIKDGAITADKIAANTITAAEIAANAITADELAANSVTAGKIAAAAVAADAIAANSIFAKHLTVADWDNLIPNGNSEKDHTSKDCTETSTDVEFRGVVDSPHNGVSAYQGAHMRHLTGGAGYTGYIVSPYIQCKEGDSFVFEAWMRLEADQGADGAYLQFVFYDENLANPSFVGQTAAYNDTTWSLVRTTYTAAAGKSFVVAMVAGYAHASNDALFDGLLFRRRAGASMVVDGTLTADSLAANTITSTSACIGSLSASKINAGTMSCDYLSGGTINGQTITGGTITSPTFRTAASGKRIEMTGSYEDRVTFYPYTDCTYGNAAYIVTGGTSSAPWLQFQGPTVGSTYGYLRMTATDASTDYSTLQVDADQVIIGSGYPGDAGECATALSGAVTFGPSRKASVNREWDFIGTTVQHDTGNYIDMWYCYDLNSGATLTAVGAGIDHPGVIDYTTAASANAGFRMYTNMEAIRFTTSTTPPYDFDYAEYVFRPESVSTNVSMRLGFCSWWNHESAASVNGYGVYAFTVGTGSYCNLIGRVAIYGTTYSTGTSYNMTNGTWYTLRVKVHQGTHADFYLYTADGTCVWNDYVSYCPTGTDLSHGWVGWTDVATAYNFADFDYMNLYLAPRSR